MNEWLYCHQCAGWRNCQPLRQGGYECSECGLKVKDSNNG